jgi:hypothetical protein
MKSSTALDRKDYNHMSKIAELLETLEPTREGHNNPADITYAAYAALPDIKRIVEFLENGASHHECCNANYPMSTKCSCGLSEIQSLIRR